MKYFRGMHIALVLLFFGFSLAASPSFASRNNVAFWKSGLSPYTWVGKGADANWNTPANWSGGVVPGTSDTAVFDDDNKTRCLANCSPLINLSISVKGVLIRAGYNGTITQGSGFTITVGTSGWSQDGGTFVGGNSDLTANGPVTFTAGVFNAPSTFLNARTNFAVTGTATFNPGVGTLRFNPNWSSSTSRDITAGNVNYNNVTFVGDETTFTLSDTMTVIGTLTVGDPGSYGRNINNGTILAKGNVNIVNKGYRGTGLIKIAGAGNQTVTSIAGANVSHFEIASTGGTVSLSGTFEFLRNYTYTSGTVDIGSTLFVFKPEWNTSLTITPGPIAYNNVTWIGWDTNWTLVGTMTVNGTLTFSDSASSSINTGSFIANGNVVFSGAGGSGTAGITFNGSTSTTVTWTAGNRLRGPMIINKTGGATLSLASNIQFNYSGQDVTVAAGTLDLAGFTLNVADVFTISTPGTLICNGGTYTKASMIVDGAIDCAAYGYNWTGNGANTNWNTAANWSGGVVPNSSATLVFKDTYCGVKCNSNISANASIRGVRMYSPFTGTITQNTGITLTIGAAGWIQEGGTFAGSNAVIDFNGQWKITGGTFTATSGLTNMNSGDITMSGGTFNANSGTVVFGSSSYSIATGSANFNHVKLTGFGAYHNVVGTMNILGNLIVDLAYSSWLNTGTMAVAGNINITGGSNKSLTGTGTVKLVGNASGQTITSTAGGSLPAVTLETGTNPVTISGYISLSNNFKNTSVGTFTATGSTVEFFIACGLTQNIDAGNITFNNVTFVAVCATQNIVGTLKVAGNALLKASYSNGFTNGIVEVGGNLTANGQDGYYGGDTIFKMTGNAAGQTITSINNGYIPKLEIAAGTNNVTLSGTVNVSNGYKVTSVGALTTAGSSLNLSTPSYGTISIDPGAHTYNDVQLFGTIGTLNLVGTMMIDGNLTMGASYNASVNTGTLSVKGNVTVTDSFSGGSAKLILRGTSPTVSVTNASFLQGDVTVNLAGGAVVLATNVGWNGAGQTVNVTAGDINMNGKNLGITNLTLNGRTITKNGGTLTVGGSTVGNGSFYGGTIAP